MFRPSPLRLALMAVALLAGSLAGGAPTAGADGELTVPAAADATVESKRSDANYGSDRHLRVNGGRHEAQTLLRFQVTGAGDVGQALLRLWATGDAATGPRVRTNDGNWSEHTVTWATRPNAGPVISTGGAVSRNTWATFDVTELVGGDGVYDFTLEAAGSESLVFDSREHKNPPQLRLIPSLPPEEPPSDDPPSDDPPSDDPPPPGDGIRDVLLAPDSGAHFGAYVEPRTGWTEQDRKNAIEGLEAGLGRTLDVDHHYYPWDTAFPTWREQWDFDAGRIPLISWNGRGAYTSDIAAGDWDSWIEARADGVAALGAPVFIRWFWEMDGNKKAEWAESPADYIAAWRHIRTIFEARGATNVAWVWCPNAWNFDTGTSPDWYPGDEWVDWICADGYNWAPGRPGAEWQEFEDVFATFYAWASERPKPLMIGETGAQERDPGEKATWIANAHQTLVERYTRILAMVYFDANQTYDWRVDTSESAFAAYRDMALDPWFHQEAAIGGSTLAPAVVGAGAPDHTATSHPAESQRQGHRLMI